MMGHTATIPALESPVVSGLDLPTGTGASAALESVMEMQALLSTIVEAQRRSIAADIATHQATRARLERLRLLASALQEQAKRRPRRRRVAA